jgi:adenylate cyclase
MKTILPISLFLLIVTVVMAQADPNTKLGQTEISPEDTFKIDSLLNQARLLYGTNPEKTFIRSNSARHLAEQLNDSARIAVSLKTAGNGLYAMTDYVQAMEYWESAIRIYSSIGDKIGQSNVLSNMGAIYFNQGHATKAMDNYLKSLRLAEEVSDTLRIATAWVNIGAVYNNNETTLHKAMEAYQIALPLSKSLNDNGAIGTVAVNIGGIFLSQNQPDSALKYYNIALSVVENTMHKPFTLNQIGSVYSYLEDYSRAIKYHNEAISLSEQLQETLEMSQGYSFLAKVYTKMNEHELALVTYLKAEKLAFNISPINKELKSIYRGLSELYTAQSDYKNALQYQSLLSALKDSLYNIDTDQKLDGLVFNFELEKKQNEIELLVKDGQIRELAHQAELNRKKRSRNIAFATGLIILLLAGGLWSRLNFIRKSKAALQKEKDISEELLLNILPEEVADELKLKGYTDAREFDEATILFTDFQGFTSMSEQMSAADLVAELNVCFKAFDGIMEKNGLEKIKTIGDAYMAAGGLPVPESAGPADVVSAGIEMQQFMTDRKLKLDELGIPSFEMRLGIHTGPVIAGVVGVKKFQYDIWGDTVNTASRMESSGEVGRVNISNETYQLVKMLEEFRFGIRGKVKAKGKGEIEMFFVSRSHGEG